MGPARKANRLSGSVVHLPPVLPGRVGPKGHGSNEQMHRVGWNVDAVSHGAWSQSCSHTSPERTFACNVLRHCKNPIPPPDCSGFIDAIDSGLICQMDETWLWLK